MDQLRETGPENRNQNNGFIDWLIFNVVCLGLSVGIEILLFPLQVERILLPIRKGLTPQEAFLSLYPLAFYIILFLMAAFNVIGITYVNRKNKQKTKGAISACILTLLFLGLGVLLFNFFGSYFF